MSLPARLWLRELCTFFPSIWVVLAPILLSPLIITGDEKFRCAFAILLLSCYWVAEVMPLAVTALMPLFLLPLLHILPVKQVATLYLNDTNFLFVSSLMMSLAVEECNLHKRVALRLLSLVGARPQWLMAGFIAITSFISLWISDTATAALMSPIALALIEAIMVPRMDKGGEGPSTSPSTLSLSRLSPRDRGIAKCIMLMVAHAALIGGTGTINSTAPNLILRASLQKFFPDEDTGVTYLSWMLFAIPPMLFYMLASWFVVQLQFLGPRHLLRLFSAPTAEERDEEAEAHQVVKEQYAQLGPISWAEKSCLVLFLVMVASWISSDPRVVPGWVDLFPKGYMSDTSSGMFIVCFLFLWPREKPDFVFWREDQARRSVRRESLLTWAMVQRRFPWSVILLIGAGFSISVAVSKSGLSPYLACSIQSLLSGLPLSLMQAALSLFVVVFTEFTTNSATASVFIPIAFSIAESVHVHPLFFAIPAAIGPSFSFMLPMATPSNAMVYETGLISMRDMVSSGVLLNVFCILITVVSMNTWVWWVFDMDTYPAFAATHNNTSPCI